MEQLALGSELAAASRQNRVDDNPLTGSGRDVRKTPGYGTTGIYLTYSPLKDLKVRAGISNLFDKLYANHLNRSNAFDPEEIQVNEPGRSFYLSARWNFS